MPDSWTARYVVFCSMDAQKVALEELLPGFVRVDQGGVTRLAQLQHEGYALHTALTAAPNRRDMVTSSG